MKVSISQAVLALASREYVVHFRPEQNLPEEQQYAWIEKYTDIVVEE